jgi:acetyltransferase-like isoleucine patch superfamily enzyme
MTQQSSPSDCPIIKIGDGCSAVGGLTVSGVCKIEVEDEVLIARNVYISDHSHRFDDPKISIKFQGIDRIAPVRIGKGAWIGQNAVIFPGVTIGRGAVIGANSVVRESVPDRCVAAGVPAKIIRRLD